MDIAARHHLMVIEDAAQGIVASYKDRLFGVKSEILGAFPSMRRRM